MKSNTLTYHLFILGPLLFSVLLGPFTLCANEVSGLSNKAVEEVGFEVEEAVLCRKQKVIRKALHFQVDIPPSQRKTNSMSTVHPPVGHRLSNGLRAPLII